LIFKFSFKFEFIVLSDYNMVNLKHFVGYPHMQLPTALFTVKCIKFKIFKNVKIFLKWCGCCQK